MVDNHEKHDKPYTQLMAEKLGVQPEELQNFVSEYMDLQVMYRSAIREVSTRLEILDDEFQFRHKRNPIHHTQSRLKSPQSVMEKMGRRGLAPTVAVLRKELTDIAGIRVICSYVDDIYQLAKLLVSQPDIKLVRKNDYIKEPKPNGYRSLHMVISVPVYFSTGVQRVPVEIQIRTIAMDFWASLEHELRYKAVADISRELVQELYDCAQSIAQLDERMQAVYRRVEEIEQAKGLKG